MQLALVVVALREDKETGNSRGQASFRAGANFGDADSGKTNRRQMRRPVHRADASGRLHARGRRRLRPHF